MEPSMAHAQYVSESRNVRSRGAVAATRRLPRDDSAQLGALMRALEPRLRAVALRITRDSEAARDVVQSAFEKAIRHAGQFRGHARVSTWMHRIVANEALMWLRAEHRRQAHEVGVEDWEAVEIPDPAPSAVEHLERRQRRERVRASVSLLHPDERDVLMHCVLENRTYRQFATETGLHPAAVKTRAYRARRRLLRMLKQV